MGTTTGETQYDGGSGATRRSLTDRFTDSADVPAARAAIGVAADAGAPAADIVFVDAEPAGPEAQQDRRNAALRTQYGKDNAERLASGAGVLSGTIRDDMTGKASERLKRQADEKRRKDRADTAMYLALLQAQIAELDRQIAALNDQIDALDELLQIIDSGAELDPDNPAHRKLLEGSGIPEDQWGSVTREDIEQAKRDRAAVRAEKQAERDRVTQELKHASGGEIERTINREGGVAGEAAADKIGGEQGHKIDKAVEADRDAGNAERQDDSAEFGSFASGDLLSGAQGADSGLSFAATASPDSQFGMNAPDVQVDFQAAAHRTDGQAPVAQVNLTLQQDDTPKAPPPGMSMV